MSFFPKRLIIISGPFDETQAEQLAKALDKVRKKNNVIVVGSKESDVKIKKVWI